MSGKKMVSLKRTAADLKAEKKRYSEPCTPDLFPYGLDLSFNEEQLKKLPLLDGVAVGAKLTATIEVMVESSRCNEVSHGGKAIKERNVCLQVVAIAFDDEDSASELEDAFLKAAK